LNLQNENVFISVSQIVQYIKYNENKISFRIKELWFAFIIRTETDIKINVTIFSISKPIKTVKAPKSERPTFTCRVSKSGDGL